MITPSGQVGRQAGQECPFLVWSSVTEERVGGGAEARVEVLQAWTKLPRVRRSENLSAGWESQRAGAWKDEIQVETDKRTPGSAMH